MDAEFTRRLNADEAPFDGVTIYPEDIIPLPEARIALVRIVALLRETWGDAGLCRLDDWFEHDGVVLKARPTSWEEVENYLASDEALYAARTGDTYVKIGIFPTDRRFYLRIDVIDESDETDREGRWVTFDLTCNPMQSRRLQDELLQLSEAILSIPAKKFFSWRGEMGYTNGPPSGYEEQEQS